MKKFPAIILVVLALAASAQAISTGPGLRVYMARFNAQAGDDLNSYRQYWSRPIDPSWAAGTVEDHGTIIDNGTGHLQGSWNQHSTKWGGSPEIQASASDPQTGYATLVAGLYINNTNPQSATYDPSPDGGRVMHILRISPSAGSISYADLGARARVGSPSDSGRNSDGGQFAMPDPVGQFLNSSDRYLGMGTSSTGTTGSNLKYKVLKDTDGDGTLMDDDADFVATNIQRYWSEDDMEIYGNRLYGTSGYSTSYSGSGGYDGYFYTERNADNTYSGMKIWFGTNPKGSVLTTIDPYQQCFDMQARGGFAAGTITNSLGSKFNATWGGLGTGLDGSLFLLADFNNDGDAMDNAAVAGTLEYRKIFDTTSVPGVNLGMFTDVELIETADGRPDFLVVLNGTSLIVLKLDDNGEFAGTGKSIPADYATVITGLPAGVQDIEIDYGQFQPAAIPEPATMLLLGTGALAALGYARRRRLT